MTDKNFAIMTSADRAATIKDLAALLKKHEIEGAKIETNRECVCPIGAKEIDDKTTLTISKKCGMGEKAKVDAFKQEFKSLGYKGVQCEVQCLVNQGEQYVTIADVVDINNNNKVNLEHKQGEVWLVDFWATWCPPCQAPMAHNQEMLTKNEAAWSEEGKKVRIIGVSIDQSSEAVVNHVKAKGWEKVEHYHRDKSECSELYGVKGVPHVMIVDRDGKIVFKGHPAGRPNLEQDFNDLREGKAITVESKDEEKKEAEGAGK